MSRRTQAPKRQILPDPKYHSELLAKFMNMIMNDGKKSVAERIIYGALDRIAERETNTDDKALELLEKEGGEVSKKAIARFSWTRKTTLPTAGVLVKGCLDECNICEPALLEEIKIDLERKKLENELLRKKTELLEKSQEYRCCPTGEVEDEGDSDD